jgi:glycosyltransferase involved in cell wall biosynthesis
MGETSIALLHAMWAGKPCVVSNLAWFAELPDDILLKLDAHRPELMAEQVYEAIGLFVANRALFQRAGAAGRAYVQREHTPEHVAEIIFRILEGDSLPRASVASTIRASQ